MITPRETRLLRAPTLGAFQRAIAAAVAGCGGAAARPAVLTPTRAATLQLRRTLAADGVDPSQAALVTRAEWYGWLRERVGSCPPLLTAVEREVVAGAAAADAAAEGCAPPFRLRPGIVAALLAFYDELRRRRRSVEAFERVLADELEPSADLDSGARRLLLQTRFLAAAFRAYDRRLDALAGLDEHRLRGRLLAADGLEAVSEVVVTVPDQVAHPAGLYPADFDLLARLPGLARVTLIATDSVLDAGYRERLDDLLPGLVEQRAAPEGRRAAVVVPAASAERPYFVWRDREEELRAIARHVAAAAAGDGRAPASAAVVVQRPLPYLYLAPSVFGAAALPVRTGDALPLAVEPYAAAVDLVLTFVAGGFRREPAVELLRSPHFGFGPDGAPVPAAAVRALDRALAEAGFAGGLETLKEYAAQWRADRGSRRAALPALRRVIALAGELAPLADPRPLADHLATLGSFLERHAPAAAGAGEAGGRGAEGRIRVRRGIEALEAAHRALNHPGPDAGVDEAASVVRRWIESRTFRSGEPEDGVHLVDLHAAAYGRFDDVFAAGLVESEWPGRAGRNVFYPAGLLAGLGWPRERERQRAARAAFHDLPGLAAERVWFSAFNLEDDVIVSASPLLEDLDRMDLERRPAPHPAAAAAPPGEALERVDADLRGRWRALRAARASGSDGGARPSSGRAGPQPERSYAVSALERYAGCPFQYFASHVLGLEAERAAQRTMTPERRGLLLHRVFESFFRDWQAGGRGAVTLANLDLALERFAAVAEDAVGGLPPVDRAVARGWLLGSAAAPGLAERVFVAEIEDQTGVVERLLEYRVDGRFELGRPPARRTVALRGVVDRIDLRADHTFRVIDYKASRSPHRSRALQLPVYARCAERQLRAERGQDWRATEAFYLAFGDPRLQVAAGEDVGRAMAAGEARVVELVDGIEAGAYPPRPVDRARCASCAFPTVCRKDDVDDA